MSEIVDPNGQSSDKPEIYGQDSQSIKLIEPGDWNSEQPIKDFGVMFVRDEKDPILAERLRKKLTQQAGEKSVSISFIDINTEKMNQLPSLLLCILRPIR